MLRRGPHWQKASKLWNLPLAELQVLLVINLVVASKQTDRQLPELQQRGAQVLPVRLLEQKLLLQLPQPDQREQLQA